MLRLFFAAWFTLIASGCNSSEVKKAVDIANGVPRKTIDTDILGINAFGNDNRFGSPASQYNEVRSTLRLQFVRILVQWDSNSQPSKGSPATFGLFDQLVASIPGDVDALLVLTGTPSWMNNPNNWTGGDPRATFIDEWVKPAVARYGSNPRVIGFQIWNEPNQNNQSNQVMGFVSNAGQYAAMLASASGVIRSSAPQKLIVTAATTSINQDFPTTLDYNRAMRDAGVDAHADIWGAHFYGKQYERVVQSGGVADFLNGLSLPIWITESGAQGVNNQLAYGEEVWPFLQKELKNLQRIYVYQFTEATPPETTYGLRNLSASNSVSDLYVWLRDR